MAEPSFNVLNPPRLGAVALPVRSVQCSKHVEEERTDWLAVEAPLEIRVQGACEESTSVAVLMRTPGHDLELALGFLLTEGAIRRRSELSSQLFEPDASVDLHENQASIAIPLNRPFQQTWSNRTLLATSSCGACGKANLDQLCVGAVPVRSELVVRPETITSLPPKLRDSQPIFARSGGLHAAGLFNSGGALILAREDIGRHNAVDKIIGRCLADDILPLAESLLLISGRASFEIIQKAAVAGIPVVCAVSAPSSLAVLAAQHLNISLIGFLRDSTFNVYAHSERVQSHSAKNQAPNLPTL